MKRRLCFGELCVIYERYAKKIIFTLNGNIRKNQQNIVLNLYECAGEGVVCENANKLFKCKVDPDRGLAEKIANMGEVKIKRYVEEYVLPNLELRNNFFDELHTLINNMPDSNDKEKMLKETNQESLLAKSIIYVFSSSNSGESLA